MTGRELVEAHFRNSGRYVHRAELERLAGEADFFLRSMAPMLAVFVDAPFAVPSPLRRELWRSVLERCLDDIEGKEREHAEVENVLQEITIASLEDEKP